MHETLKRLYKLKLFTIDQLRESVRFDWITAEQYKDITGEDYPESK